MEENNFNLNLEEGVREVNFFPEYVMFGTYMVCPKSVDYSPDGIKLTDITPNNSETKFRYHIMIPFIEMQELFYCSENSVNYLFIKPTIESNLKIQESMYLGQSSKNGLKFDV